MHKTLDWIDVKKIAFDVKCWYFSRWFLHIFRVDMSGHWSGGSWRIVKSETSVTSTTTSSRQAETTSLSFTTGCPGMIGITSWSYSYDKVEGERGVSGGSWEGGVVGRGGGFGRRRGSLGRTGSLGKEGEKGELGGERGGCGEAEKQSTLSIDT